jgi:hypothetical protein
MHRKLLPRTLLLLGAIGLALLFAQTLASPLAQPEEAAAAPMQLPADYRRWLRDAKERYPYRESLDKMIAVMMCESRGDPDVVSPNGLYHGLFQYSRATWQGRWNPHRHKPIYDERGQIYATARAWYQGNQSWWECYYKTPGR